MGQINFTRSEDRQSLAVSLSPGPTVLFELDAKAVDRVLKALADLRAGMLPAVDDDFPAGAVEVFPDPKWKSNFDGMYNGSQLHLRDTRFGWMHYLLPPPDARRLGELLLLQAEQAALPGPVAN